MSDHSIADRIKMSVDKKGREMISDEGYKIDFAGADASTPKMGDRESKSVSLKRIPLHLTHFLNNLNLKRAMNLMV